MNKSAITVFQRVRSGASRPAWGPFLFMAVFYPSVFVYMAQATAVDSVAASVGVTYQGDRLSLEARSAPLSQVFEELLEKTGVRISGLDERGDEIITFSATGEYPEECIRRLFRQIGEDNYAFEFLDNRLSRVVVLPAAPGTAQTDLGSHAAARPARPGERPASAVKIKRIVEGSQAEASDLRTGDLVIAYDGVRIHAARDLVTEVKKRSEDQTVEITIIRDGFPMQVVLNGGFIGINIETVKVPKDTLDQYHSEQEK